MTTSISTDLPTLNDERIHPDAHALRVRWQTLTEQGHATRIRQDAQALGVGEAQLLTTKLGESVWRLDATAAQLIELLPELGQVMASTRNAYAVIEKHGTYDHIELNPHVGLVLNEAIDLRLFMAHFHSTFVVHKVHRGKPLHSLQFFGKDGASLHKVYAQDEEGRQALERIRTEHLHHDQQNIEPQWPTPQASEETPDSDIDVESFHNAWRALQDTHEFFGMLHRHGVTRTQALRLAPEGFATPVALDTVDRVLHASAQSNLSIMVFVYSKGCIEIHTGPIRKVVEMGTWINILDPTFNLHLDRAGIHQAWCVRKPTVDGIVTSLELFDANNQVIAMLFGERKPGKHELEPWRALMQKASNATQ